jgi:LmbE family N-acetylglucosaminyl deacetylase
MMMETTLFFTPHQDDEVLSMGNSIIEHAKISDTHVILCSDGSKSSVRKVLKEDGTCSFHLGFHGYYLTEKEFSSYRDTEFKESCEALGVKKENIHADNDRAVDGSLTKEKARKMILSYLEKYPNAKVKTVSPFGDMMTQNDHRALGEAALELYEEGKIKDLRFYIEPYKYEQFEQDKPYVNSWKVLNHDEEKLYKAIKAYKKWDPTSRRFAIGYHSVKQYFDSLENDKIQYIHAPE